MADERHELGAAGERFAEALLRGKGLAFVARNYSTPVGELDLVMREQDTIVFVEVRSRRQGGVIDPQAVLSEQKKTRLERAAAWYIYQRRLESRPLRFDLVVVRQAKDGEMIGEHYADAFAPQR